MKKRVNPLTVVETLRKVASSGRVVQQAIVVIVPARLECDIMCGSNCNICSLSKTLFVCSIHP